MTNQKGVLHLLPLLLIVGAVMLLFGGYSAWHFANTKYVDPTKQNAEQPKTEEIPAQESTKAESTENLTQAPPNQTEQKREVDELIAETENSAGMGLIFSSIDELRKHPYITMTTNSTYTIVEDQNENLGYNLPQKKKTTEQINNVSKNFRVITETMSQKTQKYEPKIYIRDEIYLANINKMYLQQDSDTPWIETDMKLGDTLTNSLFDNSDLSKKLIDDWVMIHRYRYLTKPNEAFDQTLNKQVRIVESKLNYTVYTGVLGSDLCPQGCYIDLNQGKNKVLYYFEKDSPKILAIGVFLENVKLKHEPTEQYATFNATLFKQFTYDQNDSKYKWTKPPIPTPIILYNNDSSGR